MSRADAAAAPATDDAATAVLANTVLTDTVTAKTVLVMDGHCALCSWSARLIARRDRADQFRILPAQTERGARLFAANGLDPADPASWLAAEPDGSVAIGAAAAISVGRRLSGVWPWLARLAACAPPRLTEAAYRAIAANRYRLFGRADLCARPPDALRRRLLLD